MAIDWINTAAFMQATGLSHAGAKKALANGSWKKQPLVTRRGESKNGGRAAPYEVLWNTDTNSPSQEQPISSPSPSSVSDGVSLIAAEPPSIADAQGSYFLKEASNDNQAIESPVPVQAPDTAPDVSAEDAEKKEFERLLHLKVQKCKNKQQVYTLQSRYRKQFAETGEIPQVLLDKETRGAKSTLSYEIATRFEQLIRWSVELDKQGHPNITQPLRTVVNFHSQMQEEMGINIDIRKLYHWLKKRTELVEMMKKPDAVEAKKSKHVSYFASVPVYDLIQMDGVQTDYIALGSSLKENRFIDCIEFFDLGSRRLMAIRGYFGESNENSVDIFNRFLGENEFPKKHIRIRPDNAKGFLNLKRCITEINKHHALPDGFTFIDDYARAGTPTDKAQLESSHRAFHNREHKMINKLLELFPDSLVGTFQKRKKIGDNLFKPITVKVFDLTIEQFNESGVLQAYQDWHNNYPHSFQVDGKRDCRWKPTQRYAEFLATQEVFTFTAEDLERNIVYGGRKDAYKVTKDGLINYQSKKYGQFSVELPEKFSNQHSIDVKVTLVNPGKLAVFKAIEDGEFICYAYALKAPEISDKKVAQLEEKAKRQSAKGSYQAIIKLFEAAALPIFEEGLKDLIKDGLTLEMAATILQKPGVKQGTGSDTRRWFNFCGEVKDALIKAGTAQILTRN